MKISLVLNGKNVEAQIPDGRLLIDFLRDHGCLSVKRGCESSNCGLEGLQKEAEEFGAFIADQGAEQCGFCNPGMVMNAIAMFRENPDPTDDEIREYLAGNLCRCSGYEGQLRGIRAFIEYKKKGGAS